MENSPAHSPSLPRSIQDEADPQLAVLSEFKCDVDEARQALEQAAPQLPNLIQQLNTRYQSQVLTFDWESWPAARRSLIQSIQVEMHKQLRLLTTDLMFLKAAKQAEVWAQRERAIGDRLINLQGYCDAILKLARKTDAPDQAPE